jgi:hypothetical protein
VGASSDFVDGLFSLGAADCGFRPSLVGVRGVSLFPAAGEGILFKMFDMFKS